MPTPMPTPKTRKALAERVYYDPINKSIVLHAVLDSRPIQATLWTEADFKKIPGQDLEVEMERLAGIANEKYRGKYVDVVFGVE